MMNAETLARQFVHEGNPPVRDRVVDFLRDFDIWDDDTADEVWYASIALTKQ